MKSFGCLCHPIIPKLYRIKLDPRATPHVFMGYPYATKEYSVLSLANNKIYTYTNIIFHETVFPFSMMYKVTNSHASDFYSTNVFDHSAPMIDNLIPSSSHLDVQCNPEPNSENVQYGLEHTSDIVPSLLPDQSTNPKHHPQEHTSPIRRSTSTHKVPTYLNDYFYTIHQPKPTQRATSHHSLRASFSKHHQIVSESLYPNSQSLVLSVPHDYEPSLYDEAAMDHVWQAAMTQLLSALYDNNT